MSNVQTVKESFEEKYNASHLETLSEKAKKSAGLSVLAESAAFVIKTGSVLVLARILTPNDFGLVSMVTGFYLLVMNFGVNGFTEYNIQKDHLSYDETNAIFWLHALISIIMALLFALSGPLVARFNRAPELTPVMAVMSIGIVFQMLATHPLALLKRQMEFKCIVINRIIGIFLSTILAIVTALMGFGYWAVVIRQISEIGFIAIGVWLISSWRPGRPKNLKLSFTGLRYAIRIYSSFVINYLERSLDKVLIGRIQGAEVLGYYDRAYHLSSSPVAQMAAPLNHVGFTTLSKLKDDPVRFRKYYAKAVNILVFGGVWASLIFTLCGQDIMLLLLGEGWEMAGRVTVAFGPGIAAIFINYTVSWLHLSLGNSTRLLRWGAVSLATKISVISVAAFFGAVEVAAGISLVHYMLVLPAVWYAGAPIGIKAKNVVAISWKYFLSGILIGAVWYGFLYGFPSASCWYLTRGVFVRLLISVPVITVLYVGLAALLFQGSSNIRGQFRIFFSIILRFRKTELD